MSSDGKAPYENQQVAPCRNDYTLSCVRTSDEAATQLRAVETLELGHPPAEPTFPQLSKTRTVLLICTISSAGLLTVLNVQSVVIMLPSISADIGIPASRQQLVVSLYNISLGCLMLLWGRIADVYGYRRVFLFGAILFTISNLCLPFSTYEIPFYVLRLMQGLSGAAMIPSGIGLIASTFPPGKVRNRAFVAIAAVASLGSILGNIFGGVIGGLLSWKWAFWIPAIFSAITSIAAAIITSTSSLQRKPQSNGQQTKSQSVDWLGAAMVSSSLLLLLIALTEANVIGWSTPWIPPLIVVAFVLLAAFACYQYRLEKASNRQPLIRISMFKNIRFSFLFVMVGCFYASFNGYTVFATYFYQDYLNLGELETTLRFLPAGISGLLISFAVSPCLSRVPGFYLLVFGVFCGLTPPFLLAMPAISPNTTYWAYGFPAMCLCCSVEIIWPVISLLVAEELPQEDQALGGGLLQTANNVGRALGLAVATAVQTKVQSGSPSTPGSPGLLRGIRAGQWVNFGLVVVSMAVVLGFFRNLGHK